MKHARGGLFVLVIALLFALAAAPAFAEGYNKGDAIDASEGWGSLSDDARLSYRPSGVNPHGGYATTTNKCADCHSTHYAVGSYMLLRANSREAACDFCHGGGGGSNLNIMMDNSYTASAADLAATLGPTADETTTSGFGTGHTLGYEGNAPDDIRPAFSEPEGLACFNCHTPHGNSARALTTFHAPGRTVLPGGLIDWTVHVRYDPDAQYAAGLDPFTPVETYIQWHDPAIVMEQVTLQPTDLGGDDANEDNGGWLFAWGIEDTRAGNIVYKYDYTQIGFDWMGGADIDLGLLVRKPIFPTGSLLLLKNPDDENGAGLAGDLDISTIASAGVDALVTDGNNKMAIDWENPFGIALNSISFQLGTDFDFDGTDDFDGDLRRGFVETGNAERFPFPLYLSYEATAPVQVGVATVGEFCTDCHDGAAGLSTQPAEVWAPAGVTLGTGQSSTGTYTVAYGHDSHARGCDRQLFINPTDANNFGPECRSCHSGAASCDQCHEDPAIGLALHPLDSAYDVAPVDPLVEGVTTYEAQPQYGNVSYNTYSISGACLDGGFSFPHRTLGVNMLKDSLYGVDFDGTPLEAGEIRGEGLAITEVVGYDPARTYRADLLADVPTDDMDAVCLDCHVATIWNGNDPSYEASYTIENALTWDGGLPLDPEWTVNGWELLLKGLP